MADTLTNLVASLILLKDEIVNVLVSHRWVLPPLSITQQEEVNATPVLTINTKDWC